MISLGGYFYPKTDLWLGAPTQTFQTNLFPLSTNQYVLGTSTRQWLSVSSQNASSTISSATTICFTGDVCRTTWPTGAAQTPWTSNIDGGGFSLSNVLKETITNASTTYATVATDLWVKNILTTKDIIATISNQMWNGGSFDFYSDAGVTNIGGLFFEAGNRFVITGDVNQFVLSSNLLTDIRDLYIPDITGTLLMATGTQAFILGQGQVKAGSNATTSFEIGQSGQNKGTCLVMYDVVGAVQYLRIQGGNLIIDTNSCK